MLRYCWWTKSDRQIDMVKVKYSQKQQHILTIKTVVGGCFMKRDDSGSLLEWKPSFRRSLLQSQPRPWNWSQEGTYSPPWRENPKSMRTDAAAKMENHDHWFWQVKMLTKMFGLKWHFSEIHLQMLEVPTKSMFLSKCTQNERNESHRWFWFCSMLPSTITSPNLIVFSISSSRPPRFSCHSDP